MKGSRRAMLAVAGALVATAASGGTAAAATSTVPYDTFNKPGYSLDDYYAKWSNPYGLIEMEGNDTRSFSGKRFTVEAVLFTKSADFSVFDHLNYVAVSNAVFPVPTQGSVTFSADIEASTPSTVDGLMQQGLFGAPSPGPIRWHRPPSPTIARGSSRASRPASCST